MIRAADARAARKRYREMAPVLNEQSRRRFVAVEARTLGHGGVSLMTRISGLARSTIYHGVSDIRDNVSASPGRVRKDGGGRKTKASQDATLVTDLKSLVEPVTRGDPMQPLLWTTRSLRNLVDALAKKGHEVCPTVVGNLLRGMGYSLQANRKTREGDQHIDRDAQFQYINTQAKAFLAANEPVISVDTKKKELVGNFKNNGREWRPKGRPEPVNVHDFIDPKLKRAVPYGVYDITNNVGWVSVGTDHDTASFAVNAIRRWWRAMGKKRHPKAKRLMVFSFITINWRGKPLRSYRTIVQLIAATTTDTGLKVRAELDENKYPKGVKISDVQLASVNLSRHSFHGDWNYMISPSQKTPRRKKN
jgi:hypothetical protein